MKVIGVGFPRTGTKTLSVALSTLGLHTLHEGEKRWELGVEEYTTQLQPEAFRAFDDLDAVIETKYWRLLLLAYPEAKVILTYRDPLAWWASVARHVDRINARQDDPTGERIYRAAQAHNQLFGSATPNMTLWLEKYHLHRVAVETFCQAHDRPLLVYDVTRQEWGPLCDFLELLLPSVPFPHYNAGGKLPLQELDDGAVG